jgi:glycosyltransferase involved in cell wall biosynthesis
MRIRYVLLNAYAIGGTTRTVVNQANALCDEHDVEIASVYRSRKNPRFDIDRRVRLVALSGLRPDGSRRVDPAARRLLRYTRLLVNPLPHRYDYRFRPWDPEVDLRLVRYLRRADDGILVTTRPGLNLMSAWFAPRRLIRVAQDHMNLTAYPPQLRDRILRAYPRLDAVAVLTGRDVAEYRQALERSGTRLAVVPNGIPRPTLPPAALEAKVLIAAGRMTRAKGFDLLLDAFHRVTAKHPDWQLWIFGGGDQEEALAARIERLGLTGTAHLLGRTANLDRKLAAASIYVLSSRHEGLPMVLLEAMSAGLPVVSFDCPTGPAEIIAHGETGLLVPPGKVAALAAGICELIEDPQRRRRMGAAARREATRRYSIDSARHQWVDLFTDLLAARAGAGGPAGDRQIVAAGRGGPT